MWFPRRPKRPEPGRRPERATRPHHPGSSSGASGGGWATVNPGTNLVPEGGRPRIPLKRGGGNLGPRRPRASSQTGPPPFSPSFICIFFFQLKSWVGLTLPRQLFFKEAGWKSFLPERCLQHKHSVPPRGQVLSPGSGRWPGHMCSASLFLRCRCSDFVKLTSGLTSRCLKALR